jgi:hypothetical protein
MMMRHASSTLCEEDSDEADASGLKLVRGRDRPFGKFVSLFRAMNLPKCMVRRPTAREKLMDEESLRQCSLLVEMVLLATMRYAAYLSFKTPRPCKGHFGKQASGAPF